MEWAVQLDAFWSTYKDDLGALMPQQDAGALIFETHIYVPLHYSSITALEVQAVPMLLPLRRFASRAGSRYPTLIGEWTLSMAEGGLALEDAAKWWYRAAAQSANGLGLAAWNYDGPNGWGALRPVNGSQRAWWKDVNRWPH